ncbi:hypothetical protein FisN_2Lh479 [Fistulifera solaris]|uniref:Uncharacterized protein n=1 Tax=Fistulifera solaris TaxID=1519565 RepID=A0A1Z5JAG3_FISSO|nr:hypothetical protein FisN_2Lh479 [Fistulifera solaris]|eukprot:GAX10949.1 hypothetical protein FisN_2Lh479 [Fistulifera solaris]
MAGNTPVSRQSRIPFTLQAVFLASNRGKEVHKPPPENVGSRVFKKNWFLQRKPKQKKDTSKEEGNPKTSQNKKAEKRKVEKGIDKTLPPQQYLDALLKSRGYSAEKIEALKTSYSKTPSPLQKASYDVYLIGLVRKNDVDNFKQIVESGISPNACNDYKESIVHTVCRRSRKEMLESLLEHGATLQVCDDYGRTPLHDTCWAPEPALDVAQVVIKADARMLHMIDARGDAPLNYVRKEHWGDWINFLDEHKDDFWPVQEGATEVAKDLTVETTTGTTIPDPKNALTLDLAKMVAAGRLTPEEAKYLASVQKDDDRESGSEEDDDDYSDDDDDDEDDDDFSDDDFDDEDMAVLLTTLPVTANIDIPGR